MKKVKQFLDYASTYHNAIISYHASDMVLAVHNDSSYLLESKARIRAGGHSFMSKDADEPPNNSAMIAISQIIKAAI